MAILGAILGEDLRIGPGFADFSPEFGDTSDLSTITERQPGTVAGCLPLIALERPLEGLDESDVDMGGFHQ